MFHQQFSSLILASAPNASQIRRWLLARKQVCWLDQVVSHINCGLGTSINSACGQPLLVAVVSALVGDAGDAQKPGVAGPLKN